MLNLPGVLIICGDPQKMEDLDRALGRYELNRTHCGTVSAAKKLIPTKQFSAVFCGENLADGSYREVIREVARNSAGTPVIVVSTHGDWDANLTAMAEGAFDYLRLPLNQEELERILLLVVDKFEASEDSVAHTASRSRQASFP
jgi:DNA-binding NtrC family response regulator